MSIPWAVGLGFLIALLLMGGRNIVSKTDKDDAGKLLMGGWFRWLWRDSDNFRR